MKKIFITGAHGFLGKFLVSQLKKKFKKNIIYTPSSKECNLTKENSLIKFNKKFDTIFHLAAWTQAGDFCLKHPGEQWLINQSINTNIVKWWKGYQPQAKLIFIGTSCSYSDSLTLVEKNYMKGEPHESLYTYAMTKRMLLQGAIAMEKQYKLKWLSVVPSTLYGTNYHNDGRQMHFVFDLIKKIIRGKVYNEQVVLWGDGSQIRELIYVEDFVKYLILLDSKTSNRIINVGSGKGFSIKFLAQKISKHVGYDYKKIKYDTSKYVGAKSKVLNTKLINQIFPNFSNKLTNLDDGLKKVIEWFVKNRFYEK